MPFTLPFSPDTIRWRRAAVVELRKRSASPEEGRPHTPPFFELRGERSYFFSEDFPSIVAPAAEPT
jgi:hypothetical protein